MQYLFAILIVVAVVVCAMAQYPYLAAPFYGAPRAYAGYPGAYGYAAHGYGYPGYYNYGAYNPAYPYLWKK